MTVAGTISQNVFSFPNKKMLKCYDNLDLLCSFEMLSKNKRALTPEGDYFVSCLVESTVELAYNNY